MSCDKKQSQWEKKQLTDEIELCYGKGLVEKERISGKIPVFGSNGIVGFHNEFLIKGPGVIIGRKGSVGEVKFSAMDFWAIDTTYFLKLKKKGDIRFWYYFLLTLNLNKMNSHSAVPGLNRDAVYEITKNIPEYFEQQEIADLLAILDSRIELNQRMNRCLEAIGQAVFRRWFVDFEFPNQEGKPYKSSGGEMDDSELGILPRNWRIGKLDQIADLLMGISPEGSSYNDIGEGMPLLNGAADFQGQVILPRKWTKNPTKVCKKGNLIFCIRATIGNAVFADNEYCLGRGVAALNPKNAIFIEFIYYFLRKSFDELISKASGSVILGLSKADIEELPVIVPDNQTVERFHEICSVLFSKIVNQSRNNITLATIRDYLLPKLMSGRIRVSLRKENVEEIGFA